MAPVYCRILGIATLFLGVVGFASPHFMDFHLAPLHNLVHLATGVVACWVGFGGSPGAGRASCKAFGVAYGLLAGLGVLAPGVLGAALGRPGLGAADLMPDNLLHVVIAASSLWVGFAADGAAERAVRTV